ncbi:MAG TPA: AAA family ATPase [Candidatus Limiplasma sp.]|nr:AAA family ATPase [Candidatus Limiplasma sp.]
MDRKDEIIKLQMDVIQQMTESNLKRISDDLWGLPTLQAGGKPAVKDMAVPSGVPVTTEAPQPAAEKKEEVTETLEDLKKELESYIGLDIVKHEVESLVNLVTVQKLRVENDLPVNDLSLHMVFSGNPGTGKTMIARLMSRIYKVLGILSKGHLVETDRSGLVAGFVGQTAIKTSEVIKKALGGVLFIDEAYALTVSSENDYGQEAVNTLLKAMEDHRDDLIIIVAGYPKLMEGFVDSNPGLESRFNRFLFFPDYSAQEMLDIFDMRCKKSGYTVDEDTRTLLKGYLEKFSLDNKDFGNARGVRNLFERAVSAQANRLAKEKDITKETLMLLNADDIRIAAGEEKQEEINPQ